MRLLAPACGVTDVGDPRLAQAAQQLLALPLEEQLAAAHWMGTQPEYAGMLAYLVAQAGVTGAVRRAVKQAMFELRRQGLQVLPPQEQEPPQEEAPSAGEWTVEEAFLAAPYVTGRIASAAQLRFFLRQRSGEKAVFALSLDSLGYLHRARFTDEQVEESRRECLENPFDLERRLDGSRIRNQFVRVPVDWAVQLAHQARQRNIQKHEPVPPHAAFFWGRLPEPPAEPVPNPVDTLPDAETAWLVSSLIVSPPSQQPPFHLTVFLVPYTADPETFARVAIQVHQEYQTRLVLTAQTEEERKQLAVEKTREKLYPDESLREPLLFLLPIWGSYLLLGGDRQGAVWTKALWRELKERPDRPFHRTQFALLLTALSYQWFTQEAGIKETNEDEEQTTPSPLSG